MEERGEVDGDFEVGVGGVGEEKAGVFGGDAGLDHLFVELSGVVEESIHVGGEAGLFDRLGDGVGEGAVFVGDVALALLFEGDTDAVSDELVAEGAGDTADAEFELDLLERGGVAGVEPVADKGGHFLLGDALVGDTVEDLLGRERRVAHAVGHVERLDGVFGVVDQRDLDGHEVPFWRADGPRGYHPRRGGRPPILSREKGHSVLGRRAVRSGAS